MFRWHSTLPFLLCAKFREAAQVAALQCTFLMAQQINSLSLIELWHFIYLNVCGRYCTQLRCLIMKDYFADLNSLLISAWIFIKCLKALCGPAWCCHNSIMHGLKYGLEHCTHLVTRVSAFTQTCYYLLLEAHTWRHLVTLRSARTYKTITAWRPMFFSVAGAKALATHESI